jgi:hypothetical protein
VRKWTHSAVHQPWFINEWQASIDALDEAFAMGFTEVPLPVPTKGCHTAPSHAGQRKGCTFSDDIQLYLGLEDELYAFSTTIRHESLQQWPEKPWRLATTRLKPTMTANDTLSQQFGTTPNCHFLGEREAPALSYQVQEDIDQNQVPHWGQDARTLPEWLRDLRALHDRHGTVECL